MHSVTIIVSNFFIVVFFLIGTALADEGDTETITLLSWNLENLNGRAGEELFEGRSFARTDRDYNAIRAYLIDSKADIILLQEIGDQRALEKILPMQYSYILSEAYHLRDSDSRQLYTAIAFDARILRLTGSVSIAPFASNSRIPLTESRATVGLRLQPKGRRDIWVLSAHLKSSCHNKLLPDPNGLLTACVIYYEQMINLAQAVKRLRRDGTALVLGGDFNRRGDPNYLEDPFLNIITGQGGIISRSLERKCPTYAGRNRDPIDYFILFGNSLVSNATKERIFDPSDIDQGYDLSDHCPIIMELSIL